MAATYGGDHQPPAVMVNAMTANGRKTLAQHVSETQRRYDRIIPDTRRFEPTAMLPPLKVGQNLVRSIYID
jgi:hypothetical protein